MTDITALVSPTIFDDLKVVLLAIAGLAIAFGLWKGGLGSVIGFINRNSGK